MNNIERKKARRNRRIIRTLKNIGNVSFFTVVGLLILYFLVNTVDINTGYNFAPFGLRNSVIVSESMAYRNPENTYLTEDMDQIQKNDLIITHNYASYEDIKLYDVLTYKSGDILICHRVVKLYNEDGKDYIVTRGDSNGTDDAPIEYSVVKGKVVGVIPGIGSVVLFLQSPYATLAIFGSLFFFFLAWFLISLASYREYDKVIERNKNYKEDKVYIHNNDIYDKSKSKKDYSLVGGNNYYRITIKGDQLVLERHIVTEYKNKLDGSILSGTFSCEPLDKTVVLSVLPLAFDLMIDGHSPLNRIKKQLKELGVVEDNMDQYKAMNKIVVDSIPSDMVLDIAKPSNEDNKKHHHLFKSYERFTRYLNSYMNTSLEDGNKIYSYVYYCVSHDIEPISLFVKEEKLDA